MEVGLGEVNLQVAMSKNIRLSKSPILTIFARKKGHFLSVQKYTNFQYVKELSLIFSAFLLPMPFQAHFQPFQNRLGAKKRFSHTFTPNQQRSAKLRPSSHDSGPYLR